MEQLNGLKTLIAGGIGLLAAVGGYFGIVIPEDDQAALSLAIASIAAIVLRLITTGPVKGR